MKVIYFQRKPRPNVNFSVENLFSFVRANLPEEVQWKVKQLSFFSEGFFKRLYIGLEAAMNQNDVNHVTGDINFIAIFLRKRKTVLTILDVGFMKHPSKLARLVLKWFWIILPVRSSRYITVISDSVKQEILKYVKIDPSRIQVIYVPISSTFKRVDKNFNQEEPTILQIGTTPNKNVLSMVKALKGIKCKLDIVGELSEEIRLELDLSAIPYTNSKNISNEEVLKKYINTDILSFASTYEGFGMPIIEANTVGRVVVTSNILSMPEVAGNAAHLVDPFEVISIRNGFLKVIQDDQYRETLINNGFENAKRFDVKEIARQYSLIYKSIK